MKSAIFVQWEQCADDKQNKFVEQLNKKNCTLSPLSSTNQTEVPDTRRNKIYCTVVPQFTAFIINVHTTLQIEKPFHFSIVEKFGAISRKLAKRTFHISIELQLSTFACT
ncbi:hypothetical protein Tsp_11959 [Trichinella spiralis]|uniref:hypothetical protein n=1 Tax=Trichinella spiralis TaxID=6334 RepID=UPI0001EFD195|nr:hypothetical protein Tsp_11959 [Trichinella spiralis]